jgi:ketosteroid isomerase-like protein
MRRVPAYLSMAAALLLANVCVAAPGDEIRDLFAKFVAAQNSHDVAAVRELLRDSPDFLWVTRGVAIWGRDPALQRFATLYQGTWHLQPDAAGVRITVLNDSTAQLVAPVTFSIGAPGQPATDAPFILTQTWVRTEGGWKISSLLPIPVPPPPPAK